MRKHLGTASSPWASAATDLPRLFVHLALVELQKLQTMINGEEEEEESAATATIIPLSYLPKTEPRFRAVIMDIGGVLCDSPLVQ